MEKGKKLAQKNVHIKKKLLARALGGGTGTWHWALKSYAMRCGLAEDQDGCMIDLEVLLYWVTSTNTTAISPPLHSSHNTSHLLDQTGVYVSHKFIFKPKDKLEDNTTRIILKFSNKHKEVRKIITKYWSMLKDDPNLREFVPDAPSNTFKRATSLKDYLTQSEYNNDTKRPM